MSCIPGNQPPNPLVALYYDLQASIALGAKMVRFQDRTIEYNSIDDMIKASDYLYLKLASTGELPGTGGYPYGTGVKRQIRMRTDKGL